MWVYLFRSSLLRPRLAPSFSPNPKSNPKPKPIPIPDHNPKPKPEPNPNLTLTLNEVLLEHGGVYSSLVRKNEQNATLEQTKTGGQQKKAAATIDSLLDEISAATEIHRAINATKNE